MHLESPTGAQIAGWLQTLGIASLCQWDVLFILYRHQASLVGAEYIAELLGYAPAAVVAALDVLECMGLVGRSRVSQNVRLYQFTVPTDPGRGGAFEQLEALATGRGGRLLVSGHLRGDGGSHRERAEAARRFLEKAQQAARASRRWLEKRAEEEKWLIAI
jgi:DNA-binding MarR family transcriptional regulator